MTGIKFCGRLCSEIHHEALFRFETFFSCKDHNEMLEPVIIIYLIKILSLKIYM